MRCAALLFAMLWPFAGVQAQEVAQTALRHDEDWSVSRDAPPTEDDWWRPLKYLPLGDEGQIYVTLGGEIRARYEAYENNVWGDSPAPDDGFLWLRAMPHADLHAGPVRLFVQGIAGYARGVGAGKGPADETGIDLLQGFADIRLAGSDKGTLTLRAGRELLALGSERLVGTRYGPNIPRAFDGFHAIVERGTFRIDAFHLRPVAIGPSAFDDTSLMTQRLDGIYATMSLTPGIGVDLYWLGYTNEAARFAAGAGHERRETLGLRFFGQRGQLNWNWEAMRQRGTFDDGPIRAWSIASETAWRFTELPFQPRLSLRANIVSGDRDQSKGRLGTFNAMFPKGQYFGELSPIGPANIVNLHPGIDIALGSGWTIGLAGVAYWRESRADGIYDLPGNLLRAPGTARSRFVGKQAEFLIGWEASQILSLSASASRFVPGGFIRETGEARSIRMIAFEARARF